MAKNRVWLLPITPRILFSNKLLMTTSSFDPKLSVDKAKMLNSCGGQKAYRFQLIKCYSAGIFPCMNPNPSKLLLNHSQEAGRLLAQTWASCPKGRQPSSPSSPAGLGLASLWRGDGDLEIRFLTWTSPPPRQRKEASISALAAVIYPHPVPQSAVAGGRTCTTRGMLCPCHRQATWGRK